MLLAFNLIQNEVVDTSTSMIPTYNTDLLFLRIFVNEDMTIFLCLTTQVELVRVSPYF